MRWGLQALNIIQLLKPHKSAIEDLSISFYLRFSWICSLARLNFQQKTYFLRADIYRYDELRVYA
jgi:hypothetical protein